MRKRILQAIAIAAAAIAEATSDDGKIDGDEALTIILKTLGALK